MHGVEFAWKVHAAQEQWIARVDTKATVVITVEGAVVAAVVTALSNAAVATSIIGWRLPTAWLGTLSSAVAVVAAFLVVVPQLGRTAALDQEPHFLYFGHLRRWDSSELARRLAELSDDEEIAQLATQLTRLAATSWRKYILLRTAVVAALTGLLLLLAAFSWPR